MVIYLVIVKTVNYMFVGSSKESENSKYDVLRNRVCRRWTESQREWLNSNPGISSHGEQRSKLRWKYTLYLRRLKSSSIIIFCFVLYTHTFLYIMSLTSCMRGTVDRRTIRTAGQQLWRCKSQGEAGSGTVHTISVLLLLSSALLPSCMRQSGVRRTTKAIL